MDTIFDYIKWLGGYTFDEVKFNKVDQLILSTLCYISFEDFYNKEESLSEIAKRVLANPFSYELYRVEEDVELLKALATSKRFGTLTLTKPIARTTDLDSSEITQFAAMTLYDERTLYVCFRGTDSTLVGWKEDFEMAFSDAVPADIEGVKYLNEVAKKYSDKNIILTGHSKGGHIASYSYVNTSKEIKERVIACYNNDGPGFMSVENKIDDKMITIVPESSIIGMLLNYNENYLVVKSSTFSILQHNPYSWVLDGPEFAYSERTKSSIYLDSVVHSWLRNISKAHREVFIDTLFDILGVTKATSFHGFTAKLIRNIPEITKKLNDLDSEDKKMIITIIKALASAGFEELKIKENPNEIKE